MLLIYVISFKLYLINFVYIFVRHPVKENLKLLFCESLCLHDKIWTM